MSTVLTGAASGIGRATAQLLSERGVELVLVDRDEHGLHETARLLHGPRPRLEVVDLSSIEEVCGLAEEISEEPVDVLINNAGVLVESPVKSRDGYELTFAVNLLAPFLLTRLLWPQLLSSGQGRVVNVSSLAYRHGTMDIGNLGSTDGFTRYGAYASSKLGLLLLTRALARRAVDLPVAVNAIHPGVIGTGLGEGGCVSLLLRLAGPLLKTPRHGASGLVHLALETDVWGCRGEYFVGRNARNTTPRGRDEAQEEALFRALEALVEPSVTLPSLAPL